MKKILVLLPFITISAFANLADTGYDTRHLNLVTSAIKERCGNFKNLQLVSKNEEVIRIDQGITDVNYTTVLTGEKRVDQQLFDSYEITIESKYYDMYDHANKDWGVYSVASVKCEML